MKSLTELTIDEIKKLAFLSSWIHKGHWDENTIKYLGLKYEYMELNTPKAWRKKEYNTAFHVVKILPTSEDKKSGSLDRIFIVRYGYRNNFSLYNITSDKKLVEVNLFHDDLFQMHKYLIENNYNINQR